jgi:hypothetical protein
MVGKAVRFAVSRKDLQRDSKQEQEDEEGTQKYLHNHFQLRALS